MKNELRAFSSNQRYEEIPRLNVDAVARSIEQFGFRQPIVLDENGVIIVGDTRFQAAEKLGLKRG